MTDLPPPNLQVIRAEILSCGIPAEKVSVHFDKLLQSEVVRVKKLKPELIENQISCIYTKVFLMGALVEFRSKKQQSQFVELSMVEGRRKAKEEGLNWLTEHGLLAEAPLFDLRTGDLAEFANKVEVHCGLAPMSALQVEGNSVAPNLEFLNSVAAQPHKIEKFTCVMNVLALSNLAEGGIKFGFIGNEAYRRK